MCSPRRVSHGTSKRTLQQRSEAVEEKKPWAASKNAALFAFFVIVLPALMIMVAVNNTPAAATKLSWAMLGTSTAQDPVEKRAVDNYCDTSVGKWVPEPTGPVYTSLTCPTLPDYKNCQKYGKDSGHLYWRWQSDGCDLPRSSPPSAASGSPSSATRWHATRWSLCSASSLRYAETPTKVFADDSADDGVREWRFPAHGFTLMAITTRFLAPADAVLGADGKPTASFDVHLDAPDPVWASRLPELDYAAFSRGNWAALEATARCGDCKRGLVAFVRTYTPSQFEHGSWFDGGYCNRTWPLEEAEAASWDQAIGWDLRIVQIEEAMMLRADGHPGWHYGKRSAGNANDCLQYCHSK
ncbi:hypothetical protein E2562_006176 [Oryza meyeriana var. granulata]|uniref:Uncharacterized protein n=1 Tax=Oryza meyeriana var. granulata TaxID=110450 RepID=A0A6G1CNG4_9ORYZ|nr:hypothetical protein E2562_006176 [Oryza meyeriana var. granulata]